MNYYLNLVPRFFRLLNVADFYRNLVKILWLFFPSLVFVFITWYAFWNINQGKDLMVYTLEHPKVYLFFIIAIVFWTYVIWYSSRLVAKIKEWEYPDFLWLKFRVHLPRILGFSCFTIIILAFLKLEIDESPHMHETVAMVLLGISVLYYIVLHRTWNFLLREKNVNYKKINWLFLLLFICCSLSLYIFTSYTVLIILLMLVQVYMVFYFLHRRKEIEERLKNNKLEKADPRKFNYGNATGIRLLRKKFSLLFKDPEETIDIRVFNVIAIVAFVVYTAVIISVRVSVFIGTFPFVLLAFGVLAGFINFISAVSVFTRFSFHLALWTFAFLIGSRIDPHKVWLVEKQNPSVQYSKRQKLQEYFTNWVTQRFPSADSIKKPEPVYFVLSDGGASRSGYWVASVLSRFEDSTKGKFSKNLFCLSGASGGSLGNAAFYNLLRYRHQLGKDGFLVPAKDYLESDFLTYTLGRMLGPDVFRYVFPFLMPVKDRAFALTKTIEEAAGENNIAGKGMKDGFSQFMTQAGKPSSLPVLCINVTRMQDSRPGVISTIDVSEYFYNRRVDVLRLLDEEKDLKLSSAVVLGASFPYVSPAGKIKKVTSPGESEEQYFVDGGYFDNSGAGIVNEMIIAMRQMLNSDSVLMKYRNKLDFFIIHITNDPHPNGEIHFKKVNPLVNDLAAPLQTLLGSFGSQTNVNDSRLRNFMNNQFGPGHYTPVNLYKVNDPMRFSMNWVISNRMLDTMNSRLQKSEVVRATWKKMLK